MIGGIIQAVKGHFKDTASITDKWGKEAAKDKKSKDIEKSAEKAREKIENIANKGADQVEDKVDTQIENTTESTATQPNDQLTQQPTEQKEDDTKTTSLSILSDEGLKDIGGPSETDATLITTGDDGKDITGQDPSSSSGSGKFNQVMSIIQGVKKDLQNVGKSIESKGKSNGQTFGENTFKAVYNVTPKKNVTASRNPDVTAPTSPNVPSDAQLKFVDGEESPNVCLKQFFYDNDDNRSFFDSDILDAYKNLQAIVFTYKPEAAEIDPTQDTETVHVGLKAQDIEAQPELASAVKEDPESGYKMVDTREMTMQNAAAISEIAKKLEEIQASLSETELRLQQKLNSLT